MRPAAVVLVALAAGCTSPSYGNGHLQCAASGRACPEGFYCAADQRCWRTGTGPSSDDLATPAPDDLALSMPDDLTAPAPDLTIVNPSKCATANVKLCDGFEAATIDTATWQVHTDNGTVTLDTTRAYRGSASLKLHHDAVTTASGGAANAAIVETRTFPITGTIYARAWIYLPSPIITPVSQIINLNDDSGYGVSYVIDNGHPGINDYAMPPSYQASGSTTVPRDRWTCLTMAITQTGTTGNVNISIDDTPVDVSVVNGTTPTMTTLFFSLYYYQPPMLPAEDMWIDEVMVDDKPIACSD